MFFFVAQPLHCPETNSKFCTLKLMLGRSVSFCDGATWQVLLLLVSGSVILWGASMCQLFFCKKNQKKWWIKYGLHRYTPENGPGRKGETSKQITICLFSQGVTSWYDKNHAPFFYLVKRQALKHQRVCMKMLQSATKHRSDLSTNLGPLLEVLIFQCVTFKTKLIGDCSCMMKLPFSETETCLNFLWSNPLPPPMKNVRGHYERGWTTIRG